MAVNKKFLWIMAIFVGSFVFMVSVGLHYLDKWGTAAGVVVDAVSGEPVAGAELHFQADFEKKHSTMRLELDTESEKDGRFKFRQTAKGVYRLTVTADGYEELVVEGVEIAGETDNDIGKFELVRAAEPESP